MPGGESPGAVRGRVDGEGPTGAVSGRGDGRRGSRGREGQR